MKTYEIMYIMKPAEETVLEESIKKYEGIVSDNQGKIASIDRWGEKQLCYTIEDCDRGVYVLITLESGPNCIKEVDRRMRLDEKVLRHLIIARN